MNNMYQDMPLSELKAIAKERGIKNLSTLRKQELIDVLVKADNINSEAFSSGNEANNKQVDMKKNEARKKTEEENKKEENKKEITHKTETAHKADITNNAFVSHKTETAHKTELSHKTDGSYKLETTHKTETAHKADTSQRSEANRKDDYVNKVPHKKQEEYVAKMDNIRTENSDRNRERPTNTVDMEQLDSGETKEGILEVLSDGYGFIRCDNFLPGENDVYVSPAQIRRFNLKTGDIIVGNTRIKSQNEKFSALLYVKSINGLHPSDAVKRKKFEELTPIFPNERIHLETPGCGVAMRMVDLISPIGKGQRGMIVSQPKAGKTTLLKQIAKAITKNHPEMHLIILLIDERPEEVTDIKESIEGSNVEVIYSTFDELPENHKRVSEMVIERAKRLVEHKKDVVILLDSITRLARAYNLTVQASGRTLSGGLDPAALHMPKKFFGAARNMREGGSLTILATALVETGSRMDDVVFEEFKGTGNMELVLDRSLSEKRIFPAIDLPKSSTRRDDLLLTGAEVEANYLMRKAFNSMKSDDAVERIIQLFLQTKTNNDFIEVIKKTKIVF